MTTLLGCTAYHFAITVALTHRPVVVDQKARCLPCMLCQLARRIGVRVQHNHLGVKWSTLAG